jgi:hypothetical protein
VLADKHNSFELRPQVVLYELWIGLEIVVKDLELFCGLLWLDATLEAKHKGSNVC